MTTLTAIFADPATFWWIWPLLLLVACFLMGIVAVPAGIGGGVLYVPLVSAFFPFHLDFVRGAGLLVALASALAAGPSLLRSGMAHLRLSLPLALVASISSILGALASLALATSTVQTALGVTILGVTGLMLLGNPDRPAAPRDADAIAVALSLNGAYHDRATNTVLYWQARRTVSGLVLFAGIGFLAGFFGMGAGWANVPVLNLLMGVPLKVAAGTSGFILSLVDSTAAWIYLNRGAVLAIIAVPSIVGMMLGARIGARLLRVMKPSSVRRLVLIMLFFAGIRSLLKGLDIWT